MSDETCLERRKLLEDRTPHLSRALAGHSQLGHRRRRVRICEIRRPDQAHLLERKLVARRAGRRQLVELARPRAHGLGRPAEHLLVELRPATVADGAERIDGKHAEDAMRQRFGDVQGQVPAP